MPRTTRPFTWDVRYSLLTPTSPRPACLLRFAPAVCVSLQTCMCGARAVADRWFDADTHPAPLFEFGAGSSYTSFGLSALNVTRHLVTATLTNTGKRAGATVAQLYLAFPAAAREPPQQLKGFSKHMLQPAEGVTVEFALSSRDLSIWDVDHRAWVEAKGVFGVHVGLSSRDPYALIGAFHN